MAKTAARKKPSHGRRESKRAARPSSDDRRRRSASTIKSKLSKSNSSRLEIPRDEKELVLRVEGKDVKLTNLSKPFWPEEGYTKGDLIQYYADVSHVLLPHLRDRAMVMKRYPNGWQGPHFFMKRAPIIVPIGFKSARSRTSRLALSISLSSTDWRNCCG